MEEGRVQQLVMVPIATEGHLVAMVELAKLLLRLSATTTTALRFAVTVIILPPPVPNPHLSSFLSSSSSATPDLSFLHLPAATPTSPHLSSAFHLHYEPRVRSALLSLASSAPIAALLLDMFCRDYIDLGLELGIPPYVLFTSSASALGLFLAFPTAIDPLLPDERGAVDLTDEATPFPGFSSQLPLSALPDIASGGKNNQSYRTFFDLCLQLRKASGFLVNSFDALQPGAIEALGKGLYGAVATPPVYHIGPLLSFKKAGPDHGCITWLEGQPRGSVVFLCFGSRGSFPDEQVREIACGLERSGQRFLWVLRAPPKDGSFGEIRDAVPEEVLPEGFLERTKGRGLVWPSFAPQAEILGHAAVGGFVTHCGWNSCLESVWFGVPTAAWPLYAEQHLNAFEMVREMGVAVEVRAERARGNWAPAEEVERAVRALMGEEGGAARAKARELREEARRAVEEGGSSRRALLRAAERWAGAVGCPP